MQEWLKKQTGRNPSGYFLGSEHHYRDTTSDTSDGALQVRLDEAFSAIPLRQAEKKTALCTWRVHTPVNLDDSMKEQAKKEGLPLSALLRKAAAEYLRARPGNK